MSFEQKKKWQFKRCIDWRTMCGVSTSEKKNYSPMLAQMCWKIVEGRKMDLPFSGVTKNIKYSTRTYIVEISCDKSGWALMSRPVSQKTRINTIDRLFFVSQRTNSMMPVYPCSTIIRRTYIFPTQNCSTIVFVCTHNSMTNNQKQMPSQIRAHKHNHDSNKMAHIAVFIHATFSDEEKWWRARKRRISYTPNGTKCAFVIKKKIWCWKNPIKHRHSTPKMLSNEKLL